MSHPTQRSLIHLLLLWITILSIIQAVIIILFFTAGHHFMSLNRSDTAAQQKVLPQTNGTPSPPPIKDELLLGKGKMVTYRATEVNGQIKWQAKNPSVSLISEEGTDLEIGQDGYYLLNLQVTLKRSECPCYGTTGSECTVSLSYENNVLFQGWINNSTCSTGLLGKVEVLSAGSTLEFSSNLPNNKLDETESLTHLDIVYLYKP